MKSYLRKLEYDTVLKHIAKFTSSTRGRELVEGLRPAEEKVEADKLTGETIAASELLLSDETSRISELDQLSDILIAFNDEVIMLDASQIRATGDILLEMDAFADVLQKRIASPKIRVFSGYLKQIPRLPELGKYIRSIINKDGEIQTSASKKLSKLVSTTRSMKQRLKQKIERISTSLSAGGLLRDAPPTIRDGRYVLPVIATHRRAVGGIVRDRSESGGTFFIEPAEIVTDGNDLREAVLDMEYEIRRILREVTGRLRERISEIRSGFEVFAELDAVFAKAAYHIENKTVFPEEGVFALLKLRHPLINTAEIVSNDVILPSDWEVLIVSGPNAGGKSVLLKSIGLAAVCSQSGIGAFAEPGSTLPFFCNILVSLGDNQSISEHESTYSARLSEQLEMLRTLKEGGLALIDEPAGGTDPAAGTALALSVLEYLADSGCKVIATTHMCQLKNLAVSRSGFINGSMNFGLESLKPDYVFRLGSPGSSYTLEIARSMEFPREILTSAEEMSGDSFQLDNLIEELSEKTLLLDREISRRKEETAENREKEAELRLELKDRIAELQTTRDSLLEENKERAVRYSSKADSLLSRLGKTPHGEEQTAIRREIRELSDAYTVGEKHTAVNVKSNNFEIGDPVAVTGWTGTGIVEEVQRGNCVVRIGNIRLRCSSSELSSAEAAEEIQVLNVEYNAPSNVRFEIDLRGMSAEEAIAELDVSIDDCISAGMTIIRVIHGKGEGILMRAVNRSLKEDTRIISYRMGEPSEGGTGVTVAELGK